MTHITHCESAGWLKTESKQNGYNCFCERHLAVAVFHSISSASVWTTKPQWYFTLLYRHLGYTPSNILCRYWHSCWQVDRWGTNLCQGLHLSWQCNRWKNDHRCPILLRNWFNSQIQMRTRIGLERCTGMPNDRCLELSCTNVWRTRKQPLKKAVFWTKMSINKWIT
jgi:hypothetical protein